MAAGLGFKTFAVGEVLSAANVNGYLMQGVLVFANATARDAAITSPQEGQFAFTKDNDSLWYYSGSAWVSSGATGDIEGVTAGVGISGGGTSGTVTVTNSMATAIDAKGDLIAGTGADTFDKLTVGANNTVLTADSSTATGLKWAAAAGGGGMTLIQETVASSNSSITFGSIPDTYKDLQFVWQGVQTSDTSIFNLRFNNNSNSIYERTQFQLEQTSSAVATGTAGSEVGEITFGYSATEANFYGSAHGRMTIFNYASTSKVKYYETLYAMRTSNNNRFFVFVVQGSFNTTTAITSLDIFRQSGSGTISNLSNSSIRLFGVS